MNGSFNSGIIQAQVFAWIIQLTMEGGAARLNMCQHIPLRVLMLITQGKAVLMGSVSTVKWKKKGVINCFEMRKKERFYRFCFDNLKYLVGGAENAVFQLSFDTSFAFLTAELNCLGQDVPKLEIYLISWISPSVIQNSSTIWSQVGLFCAGTVTTSSKDKSHEIDWSKIRILLMEVGIVVIRGNFKCSKIR